MKLLVDACVLLWLASGERPLPDRALKALATGAALISAATAWEIAVEFAKGTVRLTEPPERFMSRVRERYAFGALPIDEESALHVRTLPPCHRDPFDRMLASQAIVHGATIVTPDPLIAQYPARTLW